MTPSTVCASDVCFAPSRYTGKERDSESGNDYFMARYYASAMGRFMSPDFTGDDDEPTGGWPRCQEKRTQPLKMGAPGLDSETWDRALAAPTP